jgi:glycosyltransferase involved in cell wall biosynthesis
MSCVDVIVPCYNYGRFLRECVESVLTQTHEDLRVLIIDDCSPDHTEEVARELVSHDRRVAYRRHATNRGHIATYNEGLEWATGKYTLLLSADDFLAPGALERAGGLMEENQEVGMTHGRAILERAGGLMEENQEVRMTHLRAIDQSRHQPPDDSFDSGNPAKAMIVPGAEFIETSCRFGSTRVYTPTAVVRTELQKRLGFYREDLPHSGDLEMWLRFASCSCIGYINQIQAHWRQHVANMNAIYLCNRANDLEQRMAAFRVFFENHGSNLVGVEGLLSIAHLSLAREAISWACYHMNQNNERHTELLRRFAVETDARITRWGPYRRLCWKLKMGARIWQAVRPFWEKIHGRVPVTPSYEAPGDRTGASR